MAVSELCGEIDAFFSKRSWGQSKCSELDWDVIGYSAQGRPLISYSQGDPKSTAKTLLQCAIHGDELPTLAMCMKFIDELRGEGKRKLPSRSYVVVQPLLNPDGYFASKPTRQNARGVDLNRNFPTKDWGRRALQDWKRKYKSSPRKFPGHKPATEPETLAIMKNIQEMKPQKLISIHTPLGHLDLDSHGDKDQKRRAQYLAINMSKNSGDYKFIHFGYYPGSLGNYAGKERAIPVYTLELPPGNTIEDYWKRFRLSLWRAVEFDLSTGRFIED